MKAGIIGQVTIAVDLFSLMLVAAWRPIGQSTEVRDTRYGEREEGGPYTKYRAYYSCNRVVLRYNDDVSPVK